MKNMRMLLATALYLGALMSGAALHAQEAAEEPAGEGRNWVDRWQGPEETENIPDAGDALSSTNPQADELDRSILFPEVWCNDITGDEQTLQECWKAYRAGLAYYEWGLDHRKKVLGWQHLTTRAIFFVVLTLVGIGLYFAWVQFKASPPNEATHELELSMGRVKVSSPVLGVIILTLSLAFFYLYLTFVYPVQEVI